MHAITGDKVPKPDPSDGQCLILHMSAYLSNVFEENSCGISDGRKRRGSENHLDQDSRVGGGILSFYL